MGAFHSTRSLEPLRGWVRGSPTHRQLPATAARMRFLPHEHARTKDYQPWAFGQMSIAYR